LLIFDGTAMTPQMLEERLIDFAVIIVGVVGALPNSKAGSHIANQQIRSGTSPAPNYGEAQSAESRKDFNHKSKNHEWTPMNTNKILKIRGLRNKLHSPAGELGFIHSSKIRAHSCPFVVSNSFLAPVPALRGVWKAG
jgi:hypothetical protein